MENFIIPTRESVTESNKQIFDNLQKALGFVPNMYATFAYSPTALADYLALQNRKNSINNKEREVVNLVVSQLNGCNYCKAAHTAVSKMIGFTDEQIVEIRKVAISFDAKLKALASLVKEIVINKGEASEQTKQTFFEAGYTTENLVDVVMTIGDKIITNYLFALVKVPIDFPQSTEI
ncbi:MAG: carboxymuconolactone decarboxylase family protein [Bacteroidota bacterium]|nr:carboxymuconolactone decarboxylase family protein [Bacteroidota bacterium]